MDWRKINGLRSTGCTSNGSTTNGSTSNESRNGESSTFPIARIYHTRMLQTNIFSNEPVIVLLSNTHCDLTEHWERTNGSRFTYNGVRSICLNYLMVKINDMQITPNPWSYSSGGCKSQIFGPKFWTHILDTNFVHIDYAAEVKSMEMPPKIPNTLGRPQYLDMLITWRRWNTTAVRLVLMYMLILYNKLYF